jgi:hypothetical protein
MYVNAFGEMRLGNCAFLIEETRDLRKSIKQSAAFLNLCRKSCE